MDNEVFVIFGGSGAIGSSLASQLVKENRKVILCSRNEEKLKRISK
jgi:short-subunit dehydrogenase